MTCVFNTFTVTVSLTRHKQVQSGAKPYGSVSLNSFGMWNLLDIDRRDGIFHLYGFTYVSSNCKFVKIILYIDDKDMVMFL